MKIIYKYILVLLVLSSYAQAKIGTCQVGEGKEAFISCLEKEAKKTNSIEDINFLASFYAVDKKYDEAITWYEKSAEKGDAKAAFFLGGIYDEALDEKEEALLWYKKAARQSYPDAMPHLNETMEAVHGKSDTIELYQEAITNGEDIYWNKQFLANFYFRIKDYEKREKLYKELIQEYPKEKVDWLTSIGDAYTKHYLNDLEKEVKYYTQAAKLGSKNAMNNLGIYHGDKEEYETAKMWFLKAEKPEMVCYMYKEILKDKDKALECYIENAKSGKVKDIGTLAYIYQVEFDEYEKAFKLYHTLVKRGDSTAANNIAVAYKYHFHDNKKAIVWYKKAALMGNLKAIKYLRKKGLL